MPASVLQGFQQLFLVSLTMPLYHKLLCHTDIIACCAVTLARVCMTQRMRLQFMSPCNMQHYYCWIQQLQSWVIASSKSAAMTLIIDDESMSGHMLLLAVRLHRNFRADARPAVCMIATLLCDLHLIQTHSHRTD